MVVKHKERYSYLFNLVCLYTTFIENNWKMLKFWWGNKVETKLRSLEDITVREKFVS